MSLEESIKYLFSAFGKNNPENVDRMKVYYQFIKSKGITSNQAMNGVIRAIERMKFLPSASELLSMSTELSIEDKEYFLDQFNLYVFNVDDDKCPDYMYTIVSTIGYSKIRTATEFDWHAIEAQAVDIYRRIKNGDIKIVDRPIKSLPSPVSQSFGNVETEAYKEFLDKTKTIWE